MELGSSLCSPLPSLDVSKLLPFELFLDLLLDEFSLELLLLQLLNVVELEVLQLVLHVLGILHFFVIFFLQFFPQSLVVFCHLLFFKLLPLQVDFFVELILSLAGLLLLLLFGDDIAHEHLTMQGLHHICMFWLLCMVRRLCMLWLL